MDPRNSAQDIMRCDLCETTIVQMHCDTCLVNLCRACVGDHISTDETMDHKVVKFQSRKTSPLYPRCASHEKERCEMYCRHCDIPVCLTCLASDQHLGHKLSKILQVVGERKEMIKKELNQLNDTIYPTYLDIAAVEQNRMSQLEKEYGDLSTAITKHGEDWHREIDKLVTKLKTKAHEMKTSQLQTLQKHLDEINKKIADIREEIDSLVIFADTYDISESLSVKTKVDHKLPQKLVLSVPKFNPGTIQGDYLSKLFGTLSSISLKSEGHAYSIKTAQKSPKVESFSTIESRCRPPVKQLLEKPIISVKRILFSGLPQNVACFRNEKFWTCGDSSTMALYDFNVEEHLKEGQPSQYPSRIVPLKTITTNSGNKPADITVSTSGDLIYTHFEDKTVNIVKNEKTNIEELIGLQNWKPQGIFSTLSGELLIIMESNDKNPSKQTKVARYSGSTEIQSIQFDDEGNPLFSSTGSDKYICEDRNLDICVTDCGAKAVVVVNQAGKMRFRYNGHIFAPKGKPFNPKGITTDSQGHILSCDETNCCVHIINENGQFLRYIHCKDFHPNGLCIDTDDNLFLTGYIECRYVTYKNHMKKIEYLH